MTKRLKAIVLTAVMALGIAAYTPVGYAGSLTAPTRVNAHIGEDASTMINITWITDSETDAAVKIALGNGNKYAAYAGVSNEVTMFEDMSYKIPVKKYSNQVEVSGLKPDTNYNYVIGEGEEAFRGTFSTAPKANSKAPTTFVYVADPQVKTAENGEAWAATADQISQVKNLDFVYIAGDHTDKTAVNPQWEDFFYNDGLYPTAVQDLLGSTSLASTYGNHDTKDNSLDSNVNLPDEYSKGVYSYDYGAARFVILNLESSRYDWDNREAQYQLIKGLVEDAKAEGLWTVVGFHKSLYTGASHVDDADVVEARKFWGPKFAEMGVDVILQGHDHVYSRGFVTAEGYNANPAMDQSGSYILPANAPLYMVGNHAGGLKWYEKVEYAVGEGDPISPDYAFLDVNSVDDGSREKQEQTWTVVEVKNNTMTFTAYMMKYDETADEIITAPYIYDAFTIKR